MGVVVTQKLRLPVVASCLLMMKVKVSPWAFSGGGGIQALEERTTTKRTRERFNPSQGGIFSFFLQDDGLPLCDASPADRLLDRPLSHAVEPLYTFLRSSSGIQQGAVLLLGVSTFI